MDNVEVVGACSEGASGLFLAAEQRIGWVKKHGLDVCTRWTLLGHVQSGQVGFPLLLNKALARVKKHGLDVCTRWTLLGHVHSGQVGFPLLLNKALAGVKKHGLDVCTRLTLLGHVRRGQVGFPLLLSTELAGVKNHGLYVWTTWSLLGHVQGGQVGLPLLLNISCNAINSEVGTTSLQMLLSMLYVVWRNHHTSWGTFWKNLSHEKYGGLKISGFTKSCGFLPTARRLTGNGCYSLGRWEAPPPVYKQPIGAA